MPNFLPSNYRQDKLIALNFEDQLQAGTFEYALHYLIENTNRVITPTGSGLSMPHYEDNRGHSYNRNQ